jgi:hypothetical protein
MQVILHFLAAQYQALLITVTVVAVALYLFWQIRRIRKYGPKDITGNGITIGQAKAFDNRSLALRIERLSTSLEQLKVVNQSVTDSAAALQASSESNRSFTFDLKASQAKSAGDSSTRADTNGKADKSDSAPASSAAKPDSKPNVGLAAGDILSDQLNLASQIMNLEMLYERSLTDRLFNDQPRLQTVLGFQVSITPPAGFENCVAVAEVAVRVSGANNTPVSLVALIPQEKTYNSQTVSTNARSIGGSAVASVLTLGINRKGDTRQLFVHRDSDTIAFERDPRTAPNLFDGNHHATVFGWEFRPVLGRTTVSAGTRQMLAVIALPKEEQDIAAEVTLEVKTRSYWRRYKRNKQTSRGRWRLYPFHADGSKPCDSAVQILAIPNTAKIQQALAPSVADIAWVNSGADSATVIVTGANFFTGTKIVIGGKVLSEEDSSLTLKSNRALEFDTSIASLATGDAVLIGRFGPSIRLEFPKHRRPAESLFIARAAIQSSRYTKAFRVSIDVKGLAVNGQIQPLTVMELLTLPDPILFVGTEPVPMPYDYTDIYPSIDPAAQPPVPGTVQSNALSFVRVEAWIPAKTLARSPSVAFRVPFCGADYQASQPLSFSEPTVTLMGQVGPDTEFRIAHPLGFGSSVVVDLDRAYEEGSPELTKTSAVDFRFRVPTNLVSQYQNLVVRVGTAEPYLLSIPPEEKQKPRPKFAPDIKPKELVKGRLGPIEWLGSDLDSITSATLNRIPQPGAPAQVGVAPVVAPAQFATYQNGEGIQVYFRAGSTNEIGKAEVEFQTATGQALRMPLFIVDRDS